MLFSWPDNEKAGNGGGVAADVTKTRQGARKAVELLWAGGYQPARAAQLQRACELPIISWASLQGMVHQSGAPQGLPSGRDVLRLQQMVQRLEGMLGLASELSEEAAPKSAAIYAQKESL